MLLAPAIVLHSPVTDKSALTVFVARCLADQVNLIAIVGPGCAELEEEIDWIVVGDGAEASRLVVTSSHPDESVDEVVDFASSWTCDRTGGVEEHRL